MFDDVESSDHLDHLGSKAPQWNEESIWSEIQKLPPFAVTDERWEESQHLPWQSDFDWNKLDPLDEATVFPTAIDKIESKLRTRSPRTAQSESVWRKPVRGGLHEAPGERDRDALPVWIDEQLDQNGQIGREMARLVHKGLIDEPSQARRIDFPKKRKRETVFYCCQCDYGLPLLSSLYGSCIDCSHYRCDTCCTETDPAYSTTDRPNEHGQSTAVQPSAGSNSPLTASSHYDLHLPAIPEPYSHEIILWEGSVDTMGSVDNVELQDHECDSSQSSNSPLESSMSTGDACGYSTPASSWGVASSMSHESEPLDNLHIVSRRQPREIVIEHMLGILRDWLHAYIRKRSPIPVTDADEGAINTDTSSCGTTSAGTSAKPAAPESFKRKLIRDNEDHDEESNDGRKKRGGAETPDADAVSSISDVRFACHFLKRRPVKYRDSRWEACLGPKPRQGFKEVHRVKEHLIKFHTIKPRCGICGDTFELQSKMEEHLRTNQCKLKDLPPLEGLTPDMHIRISSRTGLSKMSASEKWVHWNKILFPDDIPELIPTPYHEGCPQQMSLSEDYYRHDFLADVRTELQQRMPNEMRDIMPQLLDILKSIVRDVQSRQTRVIHQDGPVADAHWPNLAGVAETSIHFHSERHQEMQPPAPPPNPAHMDGQAQLGDNGNLDVPWDGIFEDTFDQTWQQLTENDLLIADATARFNFELEELIDF